MTALMHPLREDCHKVSQILARVGEKWSMLVVMLLRDGPRRFNDIKRNTGGISQQMLTRTLRQLEPASLLTIFPEVPPGLSPTRKSAPGSLSVREQSNITRAKCL